MLGIKIPPNGSVNEYPMKQKARGYISKLVYRGYRTPQHIQNQIIKIYCEKMILISYSPGRVFFGTPTVSQLLCLDDNISHLILYSVFQLPLDRQHRLNLYRDAYRNNICLHFACENEVVKSFSDFENIELLIAIVDCQ